MEVITQPNVITPLGVNNVFTDYYEISVGIIIAEPDLDTSDILLYAF